MAAVAYYLLVRAILAHHGKDSRVATALGRDFKGKVSVLLYVVALPMAFINRWVACGDLRARRARLVRPRQAHRAPAGQGLTRVRGGYLTLASLAGGPGARSREAAGLVRPAAGDRAGGRVAGRRVAPPRLRARAPDGDPRSILERARRGSEGRRRRRPRAPPQREETARELRGRGPGGAKPPGLSRRFRYRTPTCRFSALFLISNGETHGSSFAHGHRFRGRGAGRLSGHRLRRQQRRGRRG